jgi:membrane protein DedA with SNARE-associated domain
MGAFDSADVYDKNPYNGEQRMSSVVWIIVVMLIGCVLIAKRLYFNNQNKNKNVEPPVDLNEIMRNTLLFLLLIVLMFGPPNEKFARFLMLVFIIVLFIFVAVLLRILWLLWLDRRTKNEERNKVVPKKSYTSK